ncbi:MAG: hypothetical protein EBR07_05415, partial [Planctomycetes bacterium]|nr:hypothetical protein [Planctomycetota bacterium]
GAALELPRSLTDANAALDAARSLRTEMDALATQTAGLTRDARVNFRRVAFDLLFHGAAAPFDSQAMVIAGMRMAAARTELDQTLSNPLATGIDRKAVDEALLRFVQASANGLEPLPTPDHPEVTLTPILLPLEQAVAMLESRIPAPSPTAWPARSDVTRTTVVTPRDPDAVLAAATWIDAETRQVLAAAYQRARGARDTSSMQAITECTRAIEAGTALANQPDGWTSEAVCQGLRALAGAFSSEHAKQCADAVAAEATCVAFIPASLRNDLRNVATELRTRAITRGVRVAVMLPDLARGSNADTDLAVKALQDDAADLLRIGAMQGWVDTIGAVRAPSRAAFESVTKGWAAALRDPTRGKAARDAMDMFATEADLLVAGRFERMVRRGDPAAINACSGRSSELLQELDRRRSAWAAAWASGKANTEASRRMLQGSRMTEVLEWSAALQSHEGAERQLNAWGGFAAPADGWMPHPKAIAARSALALEAFLAGQDEAVEADIANVEADLPLMVVVARLAETLEPWLATRNTLGARLAVVRDAPARDAYLASDRALLMQLARCLTEVTRARSLRQSEVAKELQTLTTVICAEFAGRLDGDVARLAALKRLTAEIAARPATPAGASPKRR